VDTENIQTTSVKTLAEYRQVRDEARMALAALNKWQETNEPHGPDWPAGSALHARYSELNRAADFYIWNYRTVNGEGVNRAQLDAIADDDGLDDTTVLPNGLTARGNAEQVADLEGKRNTEAGVSSSR